MIVVLNQRLFSNCAMSTALGLSLCLAAEERRHVLLTDPHWDQDDESQPINMWIKSLQPVLAQAVDNILDASLSEVVGMRQSVRRIRLDSVTQSRWEQGLLTPMDGLRLMWTPLWLVLENGRNDLQFLRRILSHRDRQALDDRLADGRVEVPLGGGTGEMKVFLEDIATLPKGGPDVAGETTSWIRRLRAWVMFDKDANPSDQTIPSDDSEYLRRLCAGMTQPHLFPGHQLGRRTIENYLPFEALFAWAEDSSGNERKKRRERVTTLKSSQLSDQQRHSFPMKDGLLKDCPKAVREQHNRDKKLNLKNHDVAQSFRGLNDSTRKALKQGFGKKIAEYYGNSVVDDCWFQQVFADDPAASAWRARIVDSLWEVF